MSYTRPPEEPIGWTGRLLLAGIVLGFSAFTAGLVLIGMRLIGCFC